MNNQIREMKKRILIGNATVYLILTVSFAATIAYWVILAGLGESKDLEAGWYALLVLIVGVGGVAEIVKKVTLSTYRHGVIWFVATAVSVLTVMGTYAILNSQRQDQITRSSDAYQDGRALKQEGISEASKYAHASGYNLDTLAKEMDDVVCARAAECGGGRSISYANYLSKKTVIQQKIDDAKAYQSAMGKVNLGGTSMNEGAIASSSNPLLDDIAAVTGISATLIKNLFYLAVTILLEFAAFHIGGRVEELKEELTYSEMELLERKNKANFGITMAEIMSGAEQPKALEQPVQAVANIEKPAELEPMPAQAKTSQPFGFAPTPKSVDEKQTEARLPAQKKQGGTGNSNPVLGKNEAHYDLPLDRSGRPTPTHPDPHSDAVVNHPEPSVLKPSLSGFEAPQQTAADKIADPANFGLLEKFVNNETFEKVFIDIATGTIGCSQNQAKKYHKIGGDNTYWLMIILEAWEIASPPSGNNTRTLLTKLSPEDAAKKWASVKQMILNKE